MDGFGARWGQHSAISMRRKKQQSAGCIRNAQKRKLLAVFLRSYFYAYSHHRAPDTFAGAAQGKILIRRCFQHFCWPLQERAAMMQAGVASGWHQRRWNGKCTPEEKNCTFMDYAQKLRIVRVRSLVCIDEYFIFLNTAPATLDISAGF